MMQMVELHFSRKVSYEYESIKKRAREILQEEIDSSPTSNDSKMLLLFHKNHIVNYTDGEVPVQTVIMRRDEKPNDDWYSAELQQSWRCADAKSLISKSVDCCLVTEMMASALPPQERVRLFHGVLQSVVEICKPYMLLFKHSQQIISADDYVSALNEEPFSRPGSINVRLFNIHSSNGEMIMDTRGLTEIGLHDLQCHFQGINPNDVSRILYNTAFYIYENGPVIESGHTIDGPLTNTKWKCQFESSLLEPQREVLDINPGTPFAAGKR